MSIKNYIEKVGDKNHNTIEISIGLPYYYKCIIPGIFFKAKTQKYFKSREIFINKILKMYNYSLLIYEIESEDEIPSKIELIEYFNIQNAKYRILTRTLTNEIKEWLSYGNWIMVFSNSKTVYSLLPEDFNKPYDIIFQYKNFEILISSYFDDWEWNIVLKKDSEITNFLFDDFK